jgi:glycosyltransferase involved in cell wall biosynthesis
MTLKYALVTPARDEAANLRRLAEAVVGQTHAPSQWIVVDNGSTDDTAALVAGLAAEHPWIARASVPNDVTAPGPPVVRAFNAGVRLLTGQEDVVVKLDADVSFEPDYFERLIGAFEHDSRLGIASGVCLELEEGEWVERHVTGDHVRGATRAYRGDCLREIGPLPEAVGWDGVDELKAAVLGWRTASIGGLPFYHHRSVGERDGAPTKRWLAEGRCAHYMGYGLTYLVVRTIGRAVRDRDPAAVAMLWGFAASALRREARYPDESVLSYLREQQRLRHLPLRVREALGRRAAA